MKQVEELFQSLKKECFPGVDGEFERKLRIAFFYGIDAGHQLTYKAAQELTSSQTVEYFHHLGLQLSDGLQQVGLERARIKLKKLDLGVN